MEIAPEQVLLLFDASEEMNLSLIWMAFVLAEAVVIPFGIFLWRKESGKVLKYLEQINQIEFE